MGKFVQDFRDFVMRGNVVDLAVGVIIGGAFGKIVTSLVNDILMPFIGLFMGGVNFTNLKFILKNAVLDTNGKVVTPESTLNYGNFIQTTIDFLIVAFSIFIMIRMISRLRKEKPVAPPAPSNEEMLLKEIRDILKDKK